MGVLSSQKLEIIELHVGEECFLDVTVSHHVYG